MIKYIRHITTPTKFKYKLLFSLIIVLVACPLWGQVTNPLKAHIEGDRLFIELNIALLNKPLLFVKHGIGHHQVVWSKQNDFIALTLPQIKSSSGVIIPVDNNYRIKSIIIERFPIVKHKSSDHSFYFDATDLLIQDAIKWNLKAPETVLENQSYIKGVAYLANETIIKTKSTILSNGNKRTLDVDFSFFILPDPMKARLFDHRMGFYSEDNYSEINAFPRTKKASITRWRMEKKHKNKKISEPINPIVFYFDPATPDKWKPYIKAGVMEWLPVFEAAGFKNAIDVRDVPNSKEKWSNYSVNHSMIRWLNYEGVRGSEGKSGSSVSKIIDFRSGEILKSDILLASSYQSLSDDYFVRCAPLDKRAQQYPLSDELIGELIQFVTAHEAGHAFGLRDAHYGEYAYPFEKMRDKKWLKQMGHTPSVMTYARHNYIVQPEDGISPSVLIQKVGPADTHQIKWGYQIFSDSTDSNNDLNYLEKIIRQQDSIAWYRYNIEYEDIIGPGSTNEVVDNNNPVKSTELGLKNMKRVLELLPRVNKNQKDNALLERLYDKTLYLWYQEMTHVMSLIGGYTIHYKAGHQPGDVYTPIPILSQEEAMEFLLLNAFEVPDWLYNPSFLSRIRYSAKSDKLIEYQLKLISELTTPQRTKRLERTDVLMGFEGIIKKLFSKLRLGLFYELNHDKVQIDRRKQELQRAYIGRLGEAIIQHRVYTNVGFGTNEFLYSNYIKTIFMSELLSLEKQIRYRFKATEDENTINHLKLCLIQIKKYT
ncbi:uncharacterized protein DUF5117 [Winogradskyella pacifica]|uniref:Uncharacterized protein DUF5117 n=1 Tax=Winogradskyella pacifica TaxID=664642 RepID=A0A3D9LN24_9FLAO|nr:zinc-dependent metalloprotease [Winogradskyella pacifica]REE07797.1 uncharacterized protein DUF5117 [Winogradskyella pacifica]